MAYWLFKSEPGTWSWDDQVKAGTQEWDGVRNFQARANMDRMTVGDLGFFYHSGADKGVVGIVRVAAEAHPDSTADGGPWRCVDIAAVRPFTRAVSLTEIKGTPELSEMVLVRNSRLSVQPVTESEWARVCAMGETDPGA